VTVWLKGSVFLIVKISDFLIRRENDLALLARLRQFKNHFQPGFRMVEVQCTEIAESRERRKGSERFFHHFGLKGPGAGCRFFPWPENREWSMQARFIM
jgi:hypothetical protein